MSKGSFRDLFTMGEDRHLHRTILAYVNQVFQQISGINLITYYAATIYQNQIGLSGLTSRALAAANGTGTLVKNSAIVRDPGKLIRYLVRVLFGFLDCCIYNRKIRQAYTVSKVASSII